MSDRYCPTCNRFRPQRLFRVLRGTPERPLSLARDCMDCETARSKAKPAKATPAAMDGVDIDAIHYRRGAVRKAA